MAAYTQHNSSTNIEVRGATNTDQSGAFSNAFVRRLKRIFLFMGGEDGLIDHNEWMSTHQALGVDDAHLAEAMFMIADRDGSGTIEWKEFIGLMAAFGHDNTDARFDALFSVMDRDHNQAVDANELRNGVLRLMGMQPCQEYTNLMDELLRDTPNELRPMAFRQTCIHLMKFAQFLVKVAGPFCADGAPTSAPPVSANQHQLNTDDMQQLSAITGLSIDELKGLKRRFQHLDADGSGELEPPEFCNLLGNPPLGQALFKAMDGDNSGTLGFVELAKAVGLMRAAPAQRCRLFFRMVDQNVDGTVSLDELSSILAMLEPAVEQQGSEEQQFTLALYKALGDGHAEGFCRAVGAYSANKHFVEAFTNFLTKPHGIDLDKKHRDGDFSQGQMLFLTILMCIIGLMLTFTSVAPSQFSTTHLATALGRDDFKMYLLHGMMMGAVATLLVLPLQFKNVKWSLVGNCVLVAVGSLCTYLGLSPSSPAMGWLMVGRVLTLMGGEAGFILLMIQVNLIYGDKVTFALGVGFVAGFATIVQFMAQLSDALVDENGIADGLGLFIFAMSLVAVLASVVFVFVVNRAIAARKRKPTEFSTLNIASTLNSLVPDVGFRFKHLKQLPKRQVIVCGIIAIAWAVFTCNGPYDRYTRVVESDMDPDFDIIRLPGRILGIVMTIPGAFIVYRHGFALTWLAFVLLLAAITSFLVVGDVSAYVVNLRQCVGIPLYPLMWGVTTHGLAHRHIPTIAGPHIVARALAVVITYAVSLAVFDETDTDYFPGVMTLALLALFAGVLAAGFNVWDSSNGGTLNAAQQRKKPVVRSM